jgi:hypothetical protein
MARDCLPQIDRDGREREVRERVELGGSPEGSASVGEGRWRRRRVFLSTSNR